MFAGAEKALRLKSRRSELQARLDEAQAGTREHRELSTLISDLDGFVASQKDVSVFQAPRARLRAAGPARATA